MKDKNNKEKYYLYILRSIKDNKLYTGCTKNLMKRLVEHNSGKSISLRRRRPLKLVYYEIFESRSEAMKREYYLKSLEGGKLKQQLIKNFPKEHLKEYE